MIYVDSQLSSKFNSEVSNEINPASLLKAAQCYMWQDNVFIQHLDRGDYFRDLLRIYAVQLYLKAESFLQYLSTMLNKTPDINLRLHLLENYLEEEGICYKENRLKLYPEKRHPELAKRFVRACGVTDAELASYPVPVSYRLEKMIANGQWLAAVAFMTVGAEANVPLVFQLIASGLRNRYGFTDDELIFFTEHITADIKHGMLGAKLVAQAIKTPEQYEEALMGIRLGATSLWAFHQQAHREIQKQLRH